MQKQTSKTPFGKNSQIVIKLLQKILKNQEEEVEIEELDPTKLKAIEERLDIIEILVTPE